MATNLLYTPKVVYPFNETITSSIETNFTVKIDGAQCVAYRLYVYKTSDGNTVYDSTKVTLGATLYDGDTLSVPVTLTADNYYWRILLYWDSTNYITSKPHPFKANSSPTMIFFPSVPDTITTPSYTFIGQYTQTENVFIKYFNFSLYNEKDILLDTSGDVFSQNVRWLVNGLISGSSYKIKIVGYTQDEVAFSTALTSFTVTYSASTALTSPTATLQYLFDSDQYDSRVLVDWGKIKSTVAVVTGSYSYTPNWIYTGNKALHLESGAIAVFTFDFNAPFTAYLDWQADSIAFTGDIVEIQNTAGSDIVKMGYNGTQFYLNNNGIYSYQTATLTTDKYLLAIIFDGSYYSFYKRVVA
jgi:hypothetical protein